MIDPRWQQLAEILVGYSTRTKPGDNVLITMMETETFPLARAVHAEVIKAGARPHIEFQSMYLERDLLLHGNEEQVNWVPELQAKGMEWADVYIGLRGARNPHEWTSVPASKISAHKRAMGIVSGMRNQTRWVLSRIPNEALAQQASMSLDEMYDFFFEATLRDWSAESVRYNELKEVFEAAQEVRIVGRETDLRMSTKGRLYEVADGRLNMPDGEIFTSPVDESAEGRIYFEFPGVFAGQQVEGIRLEFSGGRVVSATADKNEELLRTLIHMDDGAEWIGEFGVGTNFGIQRFCYDILYDEKIGGTVHIALGRAYPECNGVNQSGLHWDIVKDLRTEGELYLDGRLVLKNGKFLV